MEREGDMADDKLRETAIKSVATIKKPIIAAEKKDDVTTVEAPEAKKEEPKKAAKKPAAKKTTAKKPAAKKATATKATATKAAETKEEKKPAAKKPAAKKATATKAATAKTAAAKKTETKPAAKKTAAKKPAAKKATATKATATKAAATKTNIVLQYADKSVTYDTFIENAKNVWQYDLGRKVSEIKTLELYIKPEEERVYFVVNGEVHADFGM